MLLKFMLHRIISIKLSYYPTVYEPKLSHLYFACLPMRAIKLELQSPTGNLGVWGSNPGDGEQNFGRGQIEWRKATGNHLIHCTLPCDWPCAIGPAQVGRIISGNFGVWGSNPGNGEQNINRGQIE